MNYKEAIHYIQDTARFGSNLGLGRVYKLLEFLGNPQEKIKTIHVAGTNGKGSVTAMIAAILKNNGYRTGMYTSPHLEVFQERIQINGNNISRENLVECVTEVSLAVDKVLKLGYDNPTEFEIETCVMFYYFYIAEVDFAVIEVGLGGRLDATNVMPPYSEEKSGGVLLSVITSISYDHMKILGNTLAKIAYEKAGIIKEGVPVVVYPQDKEAEKVIKEVCTERKSRLVKVPLDSAKMDRYKNIRIDSNSVKYCQNIVISTERQVYNIELSLLGSHQILNCATAVFAVEELQKMNIFIKKENITSALSKVKWIGRLEILGRKPLLVIDGAHNIEGITVLKNNIQTYFNYKNMILILGILADKQVDKMVKTLVPMAAKVICVTPNSERAESAEELKKLVSIYNSNCLAFSKYYDAYKEAISLAGEEDLIVISGSLYMIGGMRREIRISNIGK